MSEAGREDIEFPEAPGLSKPIIVQTDGGMVPIVEPSCEGKDKRKGKRLSWREAKLSLAQTGLKTWPSCVASLNLIRANKAKGSIKTKRKAAGWDPAFLLEILQQ